MNVTIEESGILRSLGVNNLILLSIPIAAILVYLSYLQKPKPKVNSNKNTNTNTNTSKDHKIADRPLGYWKPDYSFKTPTPPPFPNWDFEKTRPIPYRAFRHKYNVTMGIRSMNWDSWIELDNEWKFYHDLKLKRLQEKESELSGMSDLAQDASWELLQELCQYLPARYPTMFKFENGIMNIIPTGEKYDLKDKSNLNPIVTAAKLVQDDLAIMIEKEDGSYYLESGCICLAGFWRLKDKFGMKLDDIHKSGDVPQYDKQLKSGMNKFFRRLTVNSPVVRNNYFIQTDNNLDWSVSIGSENEEKIGWYTADESDDVNKLYFRSERQSLRRLPISGAIVFTIRTYFLPVTQLCEEPYIPRRLLNGIQSWSEDVGEYKGFHIFKDALLPYLEKKALEQEANGLDPTKEPQVYPF
ncbi:hypothetical protein FOB64_006318 [Candida albicans]|uniref:HRQ family protein 1 n=3 Tax=Candida albicans TaxID=5476 RepID=A0A8H6F123_CANAX|nr:conserved hypothetical protein [Candida albicans WO-1]KAF6063337.1 hypothetical protein FOB64_006318 [Candida albicans]KGR21454.1 hypothetical protein MG3_00457 [Candida albicans P78048]KGR23479.1 hypothetical protein MG9_00414 [Candida albicans P37037]KGT72614.1 hypothetical protein MEK_00419 [Candida albicans 12C]KGU14765.1 hypothetical protein MEQ_00409 [Candida albicans P87]KHC48940.1 hypothetical protein W5O_00421 [Candida albicans Ca6]KHC89597.1 hypothetical protein I503_00419 [Cand